MIGFNLFKKRIKQNRRKLLPEAVTPLLNLRIDAQILKSFNSFFHGHRWRKLTYSFLWGSAKLLGTWRHPHRPHNGVLLVVLEVLAELATVFGLTMPKPLMVGGGVASFPADSVIFLSTSTKNCSSFSSDVISFPKEALLFDQGVETI